MRAMIFRVRWNSSEQANKSFLRLVLTVKVKRDFPRYLDVSPPYLDVSPPWCQYFQFLRFLTFPPATNFGTYRFYYRILTLFRENLGISEILSWHEELCGNLLFHPAQWNELLISLCKICKLGVLRAIWSPYPERTAAFWTLLANERITCFGQRANHVFFKNSRKITFHFHC